MTEVISAGYLSSSLLTNDRYLFQLRYSEESLFIRFDSNWMEYQISAADEEKFVEIQIENF